MFVPYDGQSKRFDTTVAFSAQRRYTSQKIHKAKRDKAVKLKELLDSQNNATATSSASASVSSAPSTTDPQHASSPSESHGSQSVDDDNDQAMTLVTSPGAHALAANRGHSSNALTLRQHRASIHQSAKDQSQPTPPNMPFSDMIFGGLRVDPFSTYPIQARSYFPAVVDFCKEVVSLGPGYFQFVFNNEVLFEAVVTYILCVMPQQSRETKMAMMHHYGSTLSKIAQSLSSNQASSRDDVILAICNLAVIAAYSGDDKRFETHLRGIHRLVEMRGGVEGLEKQDGWVKTALTAVEALATVHSKKTIQAAIPPGPNLAPTPPETPKNGGVPVYPSHPFPPDICTVVADMPQGFRELALTGHLSIQLMNRLNITRSQIVHLMATATNSDADQEWQDLLRASMPIERMAWLTVLVYHLRSSTFTTNCRELADIVLECGRNGTKSQAEAEWLLWGACLMIASPDAEKQLVREREKVVQFILNGYADFTFEHMDNNAKRFLWSEGLGASLRTIIAHRIPGK